MMKLTKKFIAIMLTLVFALSMVLPMGVLAEDTVEYTGEQKIDFYRGYPVSSNKYTYGQLSYNLDGVFGKKASDKVYKLVSTGMVKIDNVWVPSSGATTVGLTGGGDIQLFDIHNPSANSDAAVEFSFCFTNETDEISAYIRGSGYKNASATSLANQNNSGLSITPTYAKLGYNNTGVEIDLGINRWHTAEIVFDTEQDPSVSTGSGNTYTHKLFIDGELIDSDTVSYPVLHDMTTFRLGNAAKDKTIYYDNLNAYSVSDASGYKTPNTTKTILTSENTEVVIDDNSILVSADATVETVTLAVKDSLHSGDEIRFYNMDYSKELEDSDKAINSQVVVASKRAVNQLENTYSYYTVIKNTINYGNGTGTYFDADENTSFPEKTTSGNDHIAIINIKNNIAGKLDDCYEFIDANGKQYFSMPSPSKDETKTDIIEFNICIPSGCHGLLTKISLWEDYTKSDRTVSNSGTGSSEFKFFNDGIYLGSNNIVPWNGDRWHHVAIKAPGIVGSDADNGIIYDKKIEIYVDGILKHDEDLSSKYPNPFGIRYCQLHGLCPYNDETKTFDGVAAYIDNLRFTNDDLDDIILYNTKPNVVSDVYGIAEVGETITVMTAGTTLQEIIDSLEFDEDASVRVYSGGNLINDKTLVATNDMTIVVADTNGTRTERTYSYYDIRVVEDGEFAFDLPYIEKNGDSITSTVKLFNNTDSKKTYKVFIAVYSEGELIAINDVQTLEVEGRNNGDITTSALTFASGNTAKLFVWEADEITPALTSVSYK